MTDRETLRLRSAAPIRAMGEAGPNHAGSRPRRVLFPPPDRDAR